jgi:hypothetical protein
MTNFIANLFSYKVMESVLSAPLSAPQTLENGLPGMRTQQQII